MSQIKSTIINTVIVIWLNYQNAKADNTNDYRNYPSIFVIQNV